MTAPLITAVRQLDDIRPSVPGEHWAALGAGLLLLRSAARRKSTLGHLALLTAGGLLVWRAASGRDGLRKLLDGDA